MDETRNGMLKVKSKRTDTDENEGKKREVREGEFSNGWMKCDRWMDEDLRGLRDKYGLMDGRKEGLTGEWAREKNS